MYSCKYIVRWTSLHVDPHSSLKILGYAQMVMSRDGHSLVLIPCHRRGKFRSKLLLPVAY